VAFSSAQTVGASNSSRIYFNQARPATHLPSTLIRFVLRLSGTTAEGRTVARLGHASAVRAGAHSALSPADALASCTFAAAGCSPTADSPLVSRPAGREELEESGGSADGGPVGQRQEMVVARHEHGTLGSGERQEVVVARVR